MIGLRNFIKNGNFNTWVGAASDPPNNWTAELTATLLRETNTAPNIISNYHIKITGVGAADEGIEIAGGAANYLKVNPSTEYTFSIYYKAIAGDEAGIKITSFNQAVEGTAHVDVELTETGWTRYHITFTTDADADNLQIQLLAANDTDIVYFCGGMLAEGDAAWAYTDRVDVDGAGDMLKSTYDTGDDGIVDKSETVDDGAGNASSAADVKSAVAVAHTQGTDQKLDDGGGNEVTAANAKDAVDKKHTQNSDTALGAQSENLDMNTHKIVGVVDPTANQEAATKKYVDDSVSGEVSGIIKIWSGAISVIPAGYVICDGSNDTPDLTDRFVIHADADAAGTNDVGDTGGASTHSLSVAELAAHTHSANVTGGSSPAKTIYGSAPHSADYLHTVVVEATGSGTAHTNRDKYYALAYIMKT